MPIFSGIFQEEISGAPPSTNRTKFRDWRRPPFVLSLAASFSQAVGVLGASLVVLEQVYGTDFNFAIARCTVVRDRPDLS